MPVPLIFDENQSSRNKGEVKLLRELKVYGDIINAFIVQNRCVFKES